MGLRVVGSDAALRQVDVHLQGVGLEEGGVGRHRWGAHVGGAGEGEGEDEQHRGFSGCREGVVVAVVHRLPEETGELAVA